MHKENEVSEKNQGVSELKTIMEALVDVHSMIKNVSCESENETHAQK